MKALARLERAQETRGIAAMVRAYKQPFENDEGKEVVDFSWTALDRLDPLWYINDGGSKHNVRYTDGAAPGVVAVRDIAIGEELLSNFECLGSGDGAEVQQYP